MNEFCPQVWPEDPTPESQMDCQCCGLYQQGSRMVWGEGNPHAPILIVLDNPGAREDKEGNSMVCGTRQTLQQVAHESGLSQEQIYVTYILKRRPTRKYDKEQVRSICIRHLEEQLTKQKPAVIICLGNIAVQSFFQNPEADVKSLRGSWHEVRGYPTTAAYHPLAVRRRPNLLESLKEDFNFVSKRVHNLK